MTRARSAVSSRTRWSGRMLPSSTTRSRSLSSIARRLRRMPSASIASLGTSRPAVSSSRTGTPAIVIVPSTTSRVVPGTGDTIARSRPSSAFSRLDFPAFGGPTRATVIPSWTTRPWRGAPHPRAAGENPRVDHPEQRRRAVTREFDHVLRGVRTRRAHDGAERLVDTLAALRVDDGDAPHPVRRKRREGYRGPEQGSHERNRVPTAHANHPDGAFTDGRRDGNDRVVGARGLRPGWRPWPRASRACARVGP